MKIAAGAAGPHLAHTGGSLSLGYCCHSCVGPLVTHRLWMSLSRRKLRREPLPREPSKGNLRQGNPRNGPASKGTHRKGPTKETLGREPPPREPWQGHLCNGTSSMGNLGRGTFSKSLSLDHCRQSFKCPVLQVPDMNLGHPIARATQFGPGQRRPPDRWGIESNPGPSIP